MSMPKTESGFTVIELLISIVVGLLFIISANQLYGAVIEDTGTARERAIASNLAYLNLKSYTSFASNPCTSYTPSPQPTIPSDSGLSSATAEVTITCPYSSQPSAQNISKINSIIRYGNPQKVVTHATYLYNN